MTKLNQAGSSAGASYEEAFSQMEEVLRSVEDGQLPLEQQIAKVAHGRDLLALCSLLLEKARGGAGLAPVVIEENLSYEEALVKGEQLLLSIEAKELPLQELLQTVATSKGYLEYAGRLLERSKGQILVRAEIPPEAPDPAA